MGRLLTSLSSSSLLLSSLIAPVFADVPKVDFGRMGVVAVGGSFAGLDFYTANATSTFDGTTSTLLARASNGTITSLASTNSGGAITAVCALGSTLYVAGNFSSLSGAAYANVAAYDTSSRQFSALQSGLDNAVYALYCDAASGELWAGGDFRAPVGADASQYGGSVAVFNAKAATWSPPPFVGLTGEASVVRSITPGTGSASSSLYFAGSFLTSYGSNTTVNSTNNPSVPYSSGATPFSSSLVPIPLDAADIVANPSTTQAGFSDITNILCPAGADGPGNTWFSDNGDVTQLTLRTNKFNNARGIRLGNTFLSNHGTKTFVVANIPNNNIIELTYVDPTTKANMTCTTDCPLGADSSVPYQDFLFPESTTLTGVQITLLSWTGEAAGLHLLQLLSDGAFASAISDNNGRSCFSPNASGTYETGKWSVINAITQIAATTQTMLEAKVPVGTSSDSAPTLTWLPYVSASGVYNVYVYVPGCTQFGDCASRTSVDITVNPGGNAPANTTTVNQDTQSDTKVLVYSGYIVPTLPAYSVTVKLALSSKPTGKGTNGQYVIIADRVQLELVSLNPDGSSSGGAGGSGSGQLTGSATGFGFFEWNTDSNGANVNATGVIANTSESSFDAVSTAFASALGSTTPNAVVNAIVAASDSTLFLGGSFASSNGSIGNIVSFTSNGVVALAGNGLNGTVSALAFANSTLFVGGSFTGVSSGSGSTSLQNIAAYDISSNTWSALGGGLNGAVSSLSIVNGQLLVAGNFTESFASTGGFASQSGGVATWDVASAKWISGGGLVFGSASVATSESSIEYIAGNFERVSGTSAPGWAILSSNGKSGKPSFGGAAAPLYDPASSGSTPAPSTPSSSRRRKARVEEGSLSSWLLPRGLARALSFNELEFEERASAPSPLPASPIAPAPAVLAIAFWTNQSTSDQSVILGGNFSFTPSGSSAESSALALYDTKTNALTALPGTEGQPINGTVLSLFVKASRIYAGGEFTVGGSSGFAVYDVDSKAWVGGVGSLTADASANTIVRSISNPPSQSNLVIVAGSFSQAGSVSCNAVCAWDTDASKWTQLGSGIQGEIAAVDYAKSGSDDVLVVAGSLALQDGTPANVAKYYFHNSSWAAVGGDLPGPVTAVTVNNGGVDNIFAAGRSTDGSSPFMLHWDGKSWNTLSGLSGSTSFSQLEFVPLVDQHSANSIISQDRMLLVSGSLASDSFGNVSSALYDGQTWYPYVTSTTSAGTPGIISGLFHSYSTFSFNTRHFLATGVVVLISIAIAAGIVFILLLIGVLWTLLSRDSPSTADPKLYEQDDDDSTHGPSSLLEHINAATRSTIVGGGIVGAGQSNDGHAGPSTEGGHADDGWRRSETPAVAAGGGIVGSGNEPEEEVGRPAFARYSFDGEGEGELPLQTGAQLAVLDDRDAAWWYVRDEQTGREGIVPAAYLY